MEIHAYIRQKKEFHKALIDHLDSDDDTNFKYDEILTKNLDNIKQSKDAEEIKSLLCLIVQICHNHHHNTFFNKKIAQILIYFSTTMQENLSNSDIFNIFKSSKRILLYLFQNKIIVFDKPILDFIVSNTLYRHFFYPEIKSYFKNEKELKVNKKLFSDNFEKKREEGQNDSYICELIRNDSIENFISHVHQTNIPLSTAKIKPSIFETNALLNIEESTLIEYAAYFGSIQIFQYLHSNGSELTPSLWLYAIHSNNAELINFLEENKISPPENSFEKCLCEAIKCHHNEIANYINVNFLTKSGTNSEDNINDDVLDCILRYYNYSFLPENIFHQKSLFFYLVNYDYKKIVTFYIESKKEEFESIIFPKKIFFMKFLFFF